MNLKGLFFSLFLFTSFVSFPQGFYPLKMANKSIINALKEKNIVLEEIIISNSELITSFRTTPFIIYNYKNRESNETGYAVFTQAKGRFEYFDYLVLTDKNLSVKLIKVLKYRSEFGGEIASKKWLSQFKNYSGSELKYGDDISAISGATISATSLTIDINEVINVLKNGLKKGNSGD